jgi:imidazolonepropionase-like amidohydrolase
MVRLGLKRDNYDALRCATIVPARISRLDKKLGTLEAGKWADVIVVDGDPLADLDALTHVRMTFVSGRKMIGVG